MSLDQTAPSTEATTHPVQACRAETNRANAQHSTGPKSIAGKLRSSQNSFQHGLYSKQLIVPGENPAEFDQLRAKLGSEHQPADTTEEILVDELAQHFWRIRRFRELEARAWQPENLDTWCDNGLLALVQRSMASAERSFHKSLTALQALQKRTGPGSVVRDQEMRTGRKPVVRDQEMRTGPGSVVRDQEMRTGREPMPASGFVPQIHDPAETQLGPDPHRPFSRYFEHAEDHNTEAGFVPSNSFEFFPYGEPECEESLGKSPSRAA